MRIFTRNIVTLIIVLAFSYFSSMVIGNIYSGLFSRGSSIFVGDLSSIIGFPLAYIFYLSLFFTAFGGTKKYWWINILLLPVAIFELYFDVEHIYLPILLGAAGWVLG